MITFHEVSQKVGSGQRAVTVLEKLNWEIPERSRIAILGQRGSGKTTLLKTICGAKVPTAGWVDRRAVVSGVGSLTRFARGKTTPRQLVRRLAVLFQVNPLDLLNFVESCAAMQGSLDIAVQRLPRPTRQKLDLALFYGLPCQFYLFDDRVALGPGNFREKVEDIFNRRGNEAGMILATSNPRAALAFGGVGGHLHRGQLHFYSTASEAVKAFERTLSRDHSIGGFQI